MILFTILAITLLSIVLLVATYVGVGALAFVVTFADVIVFGLLIWLIVRFFIKRAKK